MSHDLVADSIEALLGEASAPRRVREIEGGLPATALWRDIEASGFADALVPEALGGAGLGLGGAFPILVACGAHALPVPLAETMMVRAVLAAAGLPRPGGPITIAVAAEDAGGVIAGRRVPYGRVADWVVAEVGTGAVLLPTSGAEVLPTGVHGSLEADLSWRGVPAEAVAVPGAHDWRAGGACLSAAQLAGAMQRVLTATVAYANERHQFGKSIGKFQAIQQQLSVMAEQAFAARTAARIACHGASHLPDRLRAAVAKARASEAAAAVAAIGHAVHGAIGITEESDLQLYTRRLHEWRIAYGSEAYWNVAIGEALLASGADAIAFVRERLSPFP